MTAPRPPGRAAARGTVELAIGQVIGPVLQAVQLLVVSRLLGAADIGRWTLPAALLAGEAAILELGLHLVLSRADLADGRALARRWALATSAVHAGLAGGAWLAGAGWAPLAIALLPAPALTAAAAVGRADLARARRYRRLARIELEAVAVSALLTIVTAASLGPWSFVVGALGRLALLAGRARPAAARGGRPARAREAHLVLLLYAFVFLAGNVDYVLASGMLDLRELGVYFLAFNVAAVPVARIGFAANRVVVSRAEAAAAPGAAATVLGAVSAIGAALAVGVIAAAAAVPLLLGARWEGAVAPVRALGVVTGASLVAGVSRALAVARGEDGRAVAAMAATAALVAGALLVRRPDDPIGVAAAVAVATLTATLAWWIALPAGVRAEATASIASSTASGALGLALVGRAPVPAGFVLALTAAASGWRGRAAFAGLTGRRSPPSRPSPAPPRPARRRPRRP